ncbi:MAG: hypothetical protein Q7S21_00680 [archaeon]|nr:hypothetical protein [archaeon]
MVKRKVRRLRVVERKTTVTRVLRSKARRKPRRPRTVEKRTIITRTRVLRPKQKRRTRARPIIRRTYITKVVRPRKIVIQPKKPKTKTFEKKTTVAQIVGPQPKQETVSDEVVALKLVALYFEEVARLGFKRQLDLDAVINSYFYSLSRIQRKENELATIKKIVLKEEDQLKTQTKEEMIPQTTTTTTKEEKTVKAQ